MIEQRVKPLAGNLYFENQEFDSQLLRLLGSTYEHGADIGECFSTAYQIEDGNFESWYRCWNATAERIKNTAEACELQGHIVSARQAYLRASNYYRTAEFFLRENLDDPRVLESAENIRNCFCKAGTLFPTPFKPVKIPYLNVFLPGYFFRPNKSAAKKPTLIFTGGYDSYVEESYFFGVAAALERGYNVLAFDGPGQGQVLRRQKLYFRHDWENVVRPVVDFALKLPEVNPKQMILIGRSFGGYLATRAATFEQRIAGLIVDPGQYDLGEIFRKKMPVEFVNMLEQGQDAQIEEILENSFAEDPQMRFFFVSRMRAHGFKTFCQYYRSILNYTAKDGLNNIKCPAAICATSDDSERAGQAKELFEQLSCPKKLFAFSSQEGAGDHCEEGAPALFNQRIFDWLDEMLHYFKK